MGSLVKNISKSIDIESRFSQLGGVFLTRANALRQRLQTVSGLVFDWDGVFNPGIKGPEAPSTFSEPDSMGTNMLRYGLWRQNAALPATAIITGEPNPCAEQFAAREHFNALYAGVKHKQGALESFCASHGLQHGQIVCVFDDLNDLAMARQCAVRVLVRRDASPLLQDYVALNGVCDYITAASAGGHAVREVAELLLGLMGAYDAVVASRAAFDKPYSEYLTARQAVVTEMEAVA